MTKTEAVNAVERFHRLEKRFAESKALQGETDKKKPEFILNVTNFEFSMDSDEEEESDG